MPDRSGTPFELWRRLLPLLFIILAVFLLFYTDLSPILSLRDPDFARQQKSLKQWTDEEEALAALPLDQYIARITQGSLIKVQGPEWENFFYQCFNSFNSGHPTKEWEHRLSPMDQEYAYHIHLFFHPSEAPLTTIPPSLKPGATYYLQLGENPARFIEVYYKQPELGPLGAAAPDIPGAFAYPLRRIGWFFLAAAALLYIALPWPRHQDHLVEYKRPRMILADILGFVLFSMFFVVPQAVVGSTQAALTEYILFTLVFWLMAAPGLLLVNWAIRLAKYRIFIGADQIRIFTLSGWQDFIFTQIDYVQPAHIRPPRWLIILSLLGGAPSPGTAGQGMLLSVSDSPGLYIHSQNGDSAYIWFSDQMGNVAMRNIDELRQVLLSAQIPLRPEVLDLRAVFPPER
ncbi:MAG TPA: hypothetical protein VN426_11065 [Syntrophomonadaceae bacterium]|nr:hypothetical protein [Syntrophomonadaceae bacterium]